jgi:hypothetical protein
MRWLLFLSRLAFICGFAFLLSIAALFSKWLANQELIATIVIIGYIIGIIVLPVALLSYLVLWIAGKRPIQYVPRWITIANILFLIALLTYIFYANDPYYYKR